MIWEILKMVVVFLITLIIGFSLYKLMKVSEEEAEEMGVVTPKMGRDPEVLSRLERETPHGVKKEMQKKIVISKMSSFSDKEVGEDGVVRKKS